MIDTLSAFFRFVFLLRPRDFQDISSFAFFSCNIQYSPYHNFLNKNTRPMKYHRSSKNLFETIQTYKGQLVYSEGSKEEDNLNWA